MGLVSAIRSLSLKKNGKQIATNDYYYTRVTEWLYWYQGYYPKFHDVQDITPNGPRPRRKFTLGMAKEVAHEMAALVFNEKCAVTVNDDASQAFLDQVLADNSFYKNFQANLETGFALGGFVPRPYFDGKSIRIAYSSAADFFPIKTVDGHITEGVCSIVTQRGQYYYTMLEWHMVDASGLTVTSELYQSKDDGYIGKQVDLATDDMYPDVAPVVHIPNVFTALMPYIKPNIANNFDLNSPLGISIYANAIDVLKTLDTQFDSYNLEFALGKKKIIVPANMLKTVIDPNTGKTVRYFDANSSVYEGLNMDDTNGEAKPQEVLTTLRVTEHIDAINATLNILAMKTGFSAGSFSFSGGQGVKTATEVVSENSKTFRTKNSHETVIEEGLKELIHDIFVLADVYGLYRAPADMETTINFDDSVAETRDDNAKFYSGLVALGLYSKQRAIMKILDVPEEEALKILEEIKTENAVDIPANIADLVGGAANGQPTA